MDRDQRERELFRAVMEHSLDAVVVAEPSGVIRYWNESATRIFGFRNEEMVGEKACRLVPEEDRQALSDLWSGLKNGDAEEPKSQFLESKAIHATGKELWVTATLVAAVLDRETWTVAIVRDDTARQRQETRLRSAAETDSLSGLMNRGSFQRRLEATVSQPIGLAIIDIDQFKRINDQHGHLAGDDVIRLIAQLLREHFPDALCWARLGGDEFGLIIRVENLDAIREQLETFCGAVASKSLGFEVTVSGGFATKSSDQSTARDLLKLADDRLYQAKSAGRNRIVAS